MKYQGYFMAISVFFVALSFYLIFARGLNFGVDFKGGVKLACQFDPSIKIEAIREATDAQVTQCGGNPNEYLIRAKYVEGKDVAALVTEQLTRKFGETKFKVLSQEVVGPKVGKDLQRDAWLSIIITCALILIYVGFRFDFLFAPGAIIALIHDITISVGFFAYFGKEFNLPILAALLTILGYSINDTIVIYDRIRENIARLPKRTTVEQTIDISVTETMGRTIVTSLTVFMVVVILFFMGGSVLHDFAFCMIVGVVAGSYSTVFIASPVYIFLQKLFPGKGIKVTLPTPKAA
jgi:preprotein translocase subunit SecF